MSQSRQNAEFRQALHDLYAELDAEIRKRGPVCELSGRCCRFREYGHTLFLSEPEAHVLVGEAPPASRAIDDGATCPWQDPAGRCTAREARPLGCRIYYCDPSFAEPATELSEVFIGKLKELVDKFDLPWNYAPLHRHLHVLSDQIVGVGSDAPIPFENAKASS